MQDQVNKPTCQQCRRFSIGNSYEQNDIYGMVIGESPSRAKKVVIIQCGIHAREWITPTHCLWIIDQLVTSDPNRDRLLAEFEFVVVPVLNVDGYDFTFTGSRLWRKNRQPNSGSSCIGTDLNRNYAFGWSGPGASPNPCTETYYGSAALSAPEAEASAELLKKYNDEGQLVSFWDLHSYSALWMSAWGYTCNQLPRDFPAMNAAMTDATTACRNVNGRSYAFGAICRTIYQASGSSVDHGYGITGVIHSYTTEAFGNNFTPPPSYIVPVGSEIWAGIKATLEHI
jgi:murein tripeptide amidase MpaA